MAEAPRGPKTPSPASRAPVAWTWLTATDEAEALRGLDALAAAGAVRPGERPWLVCALRRPAAAIPWARWALRLGERAGFAERAGEAAVAVAALCARGAPGAPDDLARASIACRVLGRIADPACAAAWMLRLGDHPPAAPLENPSDEARARFDPGTREAVALWVVAALAAREDPEPWAAFGAAVAAPIALLDGLADLWLGGAPAEAPASLERAALTPLLAAWLDDPALAPRLLLALAGERASRARRYEIHGVVAGQAFRARLAAVADGALAAARAALAPGRLSAAGAELLDVLGERFRFYDGLMAFRDLLGVDRAGPWLGPAPAPRPPAADAPLRDAEEDARAALSFLEATAPWRGSWEVHRFGLLGSDARPVAHWFVRGLILQALAEAGEDVSAAAGDLLAEVPAADLRHYVGFRAVPPDGDVLGLALELASAGPARDRAEIWIAILRANAAGDGVIPTWLPRGPSGPTTDAPDVAWAGDDCTAVRLRLLCGLLAFDAPRFDAWIQGNARRVLGRAREGVVEGSYYYHPTYAALLLLRFARLYRERAADRSLAPAIDAAEAAARARALGAQRLDGGWGTPQQTAACLEIVAAERSGAAPLALARGARYLGEAQLSDGSWPAEPFYPIPMKRGRAGRHRGRALTTALCARALRIAARAAGGGAG